MVKIRCNCCGKMVEGDDEPRMLFVNHVLDEHCGNIPWNLFISRQSCYEKIYYEAMRRKGKPFEVIE